MDRSGRPGRVASKHGRTCRGEKALRTLRDRIGGATSVQSGEPIRAWALLAEFLGFSFAVGPDTKRTIAPKSLERFKKRIREITRRAKGVSIMTTMAELAPYMRGWRGYFGFCETPEVLIALTRWVRLRLRAALWRQWKTPRRRRTALIALGVSGELRNTAGSGRGPWHIARSKALSVGLSNAHFKSLGLLSLVEAR